MYRDNDKALKNYHGHDKPITKKIIGAISDNLISIS